MPVELAVEVEDRRVLEALTQLSSRVDNMTPVMEEISHVLWDGVEEAFARQADPATGQPWEALADATVRQRSRAGHWPGKILQVSGQLVASFTPDHGPDFALVGTNKEYAVFHQEGTSKMPARPPLGLSDDSAEEILAVIGRYLSVD
jgi:phage virion morphogenesis protein